MFNNIHWRDLIFQMISVSFGVLLALWVNQWQESKREHKELDIAVQGLANEIDYNKQFLSQRTIYYERVIAQIDSVALIKPNISRSDVPAYGGLNPPFLRRSSFDLSMSTGVLRLMSYDRSERLLQTYAFQEFYLKVVDVLVNQFISSAYNEETKMQEVKSIFKEWRLMGQELIHSHEKVLEYLPEPKDISASS